MPPLKCSVICWYMPLLTRDGKCSEYHMSNADNWYILEKDIIFFSIYFASSFDRFDHSPPILQAMPLLTPDGNCTQYNTGHASITCLKWKEDLYQLIVVGRADLRFSKGTGYVKWVGGNDPDKKFSEFNLLEVQGTSKKLCSFFLNL